MMPQVVAEGTIFHSPDRPAFMPVVTPLSDGSWIAAQYSASELGAADTQVQVLETRDQGATWQMHPGLPPGCNGDGWSYRGPAIVEVPDGRLLMSANRYRYRSQDEGLFDSKTGAIQHSERVLFWSTDRGRTWSPPRVVPVDLPTDKMSCHGMGRILRIAQDCWIYPLQTGKPVTAEELDHRAVAVFSNDQGHTWGGLTVVANDPENRIEYHDQNSTILPDGRIYTITVTVYDTGGR